MLPRVQWRSSAAQRRLIPTLKRLTAAGYPTDRIARRSDGRRDDRCGLTFVSVPGASRPHRRGARLCRSRPARAYGSIKRTPEIDLYKWVYKLAPVTPSELVADCLELAVNVRELDMWASPATSPR